MILTMESIDRSASSRVRQPGSSCSCRHQSRSSPFGEVLMIANFKSFKDIITPSQVVSIPVFLLCTTLATSAPNEERGEFSNKIPPPPTIPLKKKNFLMVAVHPLAVKNRNNINFIFICNNSDIHDQDGKQHRPYQPQYPVNQHRSLVNAFRASHKLTSLTRLPGGRASNIRQEINISNPPAGFGSNNVKQWGSDLNILPT